MVDAAIVSSVRRYLRNVQEQGIPVSFGVVFGSQATGRAHHWSDIDLVVVSARFDRGIDREDVDRLWRIAARTDSRIEPLPCGERQWREDDSDPIVAVARMEGMSVEPGKAKQG